MDIKEALEKIFEDHRINSTKLSTITTDGASAMCGKHNGVIALMRQEDKFPDFLAYHCIIHQESLCAKQVNLASVMSVVVEIVCFS